MQSFDPEGDKDGVLAMPVQSVVLNKISLSQDAFLKMAQTIATTPYSQESGEGFYVCELDHAVLSAFYLVGLPTYEQRYDVESNEFVKEKTIRVTPIRFTVNMEQQCLELYGGERYTGRISQLLASLTDYQITIEEIHLSISRFLTALSAKGVRYDVTKVRLKGFPIFHDILGDCTLNLKELGNGRDLVLKNSEYIKQLTLLVHCDKDTKIAVSVSQQGRLVTYGEQTDLGCKAFAELKRVITEVS